MAIYDFGFLSILKDLYGPGVAYEILYGLPPLQYEITEMRLP